MKKFIVLFGFLLATVPALAQYQGQWRATHAYEMPLNTGYVGINFTGEFFPVNYFSVSAAYTAFLPASGKASGFDINTKYYFTEKEKQWYGLFGYGHYLRSMEVDPQLRETTNSINVGVGGMLKFRDELGINPEIRYQPFGRNDILFKLGVVYFIN